MFQNILGELGEHDLKQLLKEISEDLRYRRERPIAHVAQMFADALGDTILAHEYQAAIGRTHARIDRKYSLRAR